MKEYIKMIIFIIILGSLASGVLIGMDIITKDRIEANKRLEFQQTVLEANKTEYTLADIDDIFNEYIVIDERTVDNKPYTLYTHNVTNNISFTFRGNGLWGDIYGMMTLQSDFKTIVEITILEQEETPGLGAIVAERQYLNNYVGKVFDPTINITKSPVTDSDVDQITGATGTSSAFQRILNNVYMEYYKLYVGIEEIPEDELDMINILIANDYNVDSDDRDINDIFTSQYLTHKTEELTLYENLTTGTFTYKFESEDGFNDFGNVPGPIIGFTVLDSDFKTIYKIKVVEHNEFRGEVLLTDEHLELAIGKKFPEIIFAETPTKDNEIDGALDKIDGETGATIKYTTAAFTKVLNDSYTNYFNEFSNKVILTAEEKLMRNILLTNNISIQGVVIIDEFNNKFTKEEKSGLELYTNTVNGSYTFFFESDNGFDKFGNNPGPIKGLLVLESDFETINKIKVLEEHEYRGSELLADRQLALSIGKKFPYVEFVEYPKEDNELDGVANVTVTTNTFEKVLNDTYVAFHKEFREGKLLTTEERLMRNILIANGYDTDVESFNIKTTFETDFTKEIDKGLTLYENVNGRFTFTFKSKNGFDDYNNVPGPIKGLVVLENDFETIFKISVIKENENRGSKLLTEENLDKAKGKKFPYIEFVEFPKEDNELDGFTGVTITTNLFEKVLNDTYVSYLNAFNAGSLLTTEERLMQNILIANDVAIVDGNISKTFTDSFSKEVSENGQLILYKHTISGRYSYTFVSKNGFDLFANIPGPIKGVMVLDADFQTIYKIKITKENEYRGSKILTDEHLEKAIGKKFPEVEFVADPIEDNEIDGSTGVNVTGLVFAEALNSSYIEYRETFKDGEK